MNKEEYFFYINWEDMEKNPYRVGMLAKIENMFYLKMNSKEKSEFAYKRGYIGIPGFQEEKVYASNEMFEFFKRRIQKDSEEYNELIKTSGRSMVDSFFVEEVPEKLRGKCKEIILQMYEIQNKNKDQNLQNARNV